jgi:hypothetical protein
MEKCSAGMEAGCWNRPLILNGCYNRWSKFGLIEKTHADTDRSQQTLA